MEQIPKPAATPQRRLKAGHVSFAHQREISGPTCGQDIAQTWRYDEAYRIANNSGRCETSPILRLLRGLLFLRTFVYAFDICLIKTLPDK